jgi:arsenate reductase
MNPNAVRVMQEAGVDILSQWSKTADELKAVDFDAVITVCGHADETCPTWLKKETPIIHIGFDDPPKLARDAATEDEALSHYRRVRDEIQAFVRTLPDSIRSHLKN